MDKKKNAFLEKTKFIYELLRLAFLVLLVTVIVLFVIKYVWQTIKIEGESMLPNYKDGDQILISKLGSHDNYKRYDVIVFKPYNDDDPSTAEDESEMLYIKRVIGLPGETVTINVDGSISIGDAAGNVMLLDDDKYGSGMLVRGINWNLDDSNYFETVKLEEGQYFVMGDNRDISLDSRSAQIQAINKGCIIGKYILGISPFGKK